MNKFSKWLNDEFLDWEKERGEKQTYKAFAQYLDVKPTTFSTWINDGGPPDEENLEKISLKLGDEIYDILNLPRPDHRIAEIKERYEVMPIKEQDDFIKWLNEYLISHGFTKIK